MTIFLAILKVIGWILLILLLLIIAAACLVLFVPVRYQADVFSHGKTDAKVRVLWLLRLVRFYMTYSGQEFSAKIYILFFPLKLGSMGKTEAKKEAGANVRKAAEDLTEDIENERPSPETGKEAEQNEGRTAKLIEKAAEKSNADDVVKSAERVEKAAGSDKSGMIASIWGMLKNIKVTIEKGKKLLEDRRNKEAVLHLKKELFYLLKKIMPKRMKVKAVYSTGSPDTTGEVLGILALFPIGYKKRWNIAPDFTADHFYIDGEAGIRGCVFVYQLAGVILRILLDKNCRRLYNKINA